MDKWWSRTGMKVQSDRVIEGQTDKTTVQRRDYLVTGWRDIRSSSNGASEKRINSGVNCLPDGKAEG